MASAAAATGCTTGGKTGGTTAGAGLGSDVRGGLGWDSSTIGAGCAGVMALTTASWRSRLGSSSVPGALGSSGRSTIS